MKFKKSTIFLYLLCKLCKTTLFNCIMIILGFSLGFGYMYFRYHLYTEVEHRQEQLQYLTQLLYEKNQINNKIYETLDILNERYKVRKIKSYIDDSTNIFLKSYFKY